LLDGLVLLLLEWLMLLGLMLRRWRLAASGLLLRRWLVDAHRRANRVIDRTRHDIESQNDGDPTIGSERVSQALLP